MASDSSGFPGISRPLVLICVFYASKYPRPKFIRKKVTCVALGNFLKFGSFEVFASSVKHRFSRQKNDDFSAKKSDFSNLKSRIESSFIVLTFQQIKILAECKRFVQVLGGSRKVVKTFRMCSDMSRNDLFSI